MTTAEFIAKQEAKIDAIIKNDVPLMIAVSSITAVISNRVWGKGLNSKDAIIGNYGTNPIYVSATATPKPKKLTGKNGSDTFKNGKKHKSGYFDSYYNYKKSVGLNKVVQTVDLRLTGETHRDWANGDIANPTAEKINQHEYQQSLSKENAVKIEKYGKVFQPTTKEKKLFIEVLQKELNKAML